MVCFEVRCRDGGIDISCDMNQGWGDTESDEKETYLK